jgi:hypothetical protein
VRVLGCRGAGEIAARPSIGALVDPLGGQSVLARPFTLSPALMHPRTAAHETYAFCASTAGRELASTARGGSPRRAAGASWRKLARNGRMIALHEDSMENTARPHPRCWVRLTEPGDTCCVTDRLCPFACVLLSRTIFRDRRE